MIIKLTRGFWTIVDDADGDNLANFKWHVSFGNSGPVAVRRKKGSKKSLIMHRVIMNAPDGIQVDHINGDTLDNRRSNLRLCTARQNCQNRIKVRGRVTFRGVHKHRNKFLACITVDGSTITLGRFDDPEHAAHAYDRAARAYFGAFARPNFR